MWAGGNRLIPTQMAGEALGGGLATMVSCGGAHSAAVVEGGALWLWGWNRYGQCAAPDAADLLAPRRAPPHEMAGAPAVFVSCGGSHTAVIAGLSCRCRARVACDAPLMCPVYVWARRVLRWWEREDNVPDLCSQGGRAGGH